MTAGYGAVPVLGRLTVALKVELFPPSVAVTEILELDTVPVVVGISPLAP
jgi:hypothetical protein